ncbi:hypothetical protein [Pseudomonas helleri]|uniref:Uncharacterized protein n=1 Tax=Pseudomonas helleri TaxID=1608996 RepID=A0A6L5HXH5_9PSED|nr:hypothetical protein [Pseudomonas helleri]MQU07758.1 hypothetical protein [Pseudomonas helleri]
MPKNIANNKADEDNAEFKHITKAEYEKSFKVASFEGDLDFSNLDEAVIEAPNGSSVNAIDDDVLSDDDLFLIDWGDDLLDFSLDILDSSSSKSVLNGLDLECSLDDFEDSLNGFKQEEFGEAKCQYEDDESVAREIEIVKVGLFDLIEKIKEYRASEVKAGHGSFSTKNNVEEFYLPEYIMQLLNEYGFKADIKILKLSGPRHRVEFLNYIFEKDIVLTNNVCRFEYECTLKKSLSNLFLFTKPSGCIYGTGLTYVQYLYNTTKGQGAWQHFYSEDAIRAEGHSIIPSKYYNAANKMLFSLYSIWSFRKDAKKGGRKRQYLK